jgi:hypothetical protein
MDEPGRVGLGHAKAGLADRDDKFHLVLVVLGTRRIGDGSAGFDQGGWGLAEAEGHFDRLVDGSAHFDGVRVVVAADEEEAADGWRPLRPRTGSEGTEGGFQR